MANTRKPAKGQAPKVEKAVEDAVVIDEKDATKVETGADKGAAMTTKPSKTPAAKPAAKPAKVAAKPSRKTATASAKADAGDANVSAKSSVTAVPDAGAKATGKSAGKPEDAPKSAAPKDAPDAGKPTSDVKSSKEKPAVSKPVPTTPPKAPRRGGFAPMLLGGAIVAALGFGAARYPDQWPFVSGTTEDPLAIEMASLSDRLTALEGQGTAQGTALAALQNDDGLATARGEITGEFGQMRTQLEAMSTAMGDLENRLHTVEKLPQGSGMEAAAAAATAYERELQQMREMLDQELAKISSAKEDAATLEVSAAEAAKAAGARAALARVLAAIDTGRPYGDALFDLTEQAGVEAPVALAAHADKGVMTLSALQAMFPEVARAALDASVRAAVAAGEMDRVSAFVRLQLGTRSLEPKDGTDADAILSRAEGALQVGQIDVALAELAALPDAGKPALEGWVADATARKDALAAGDALAQLVNKN